MTAPLCVVDTETTAQPGALALAPTAAGPMFAALAPNVPTKKTCIECGRPLSGKNNARGRCTTCYARWRRHQANRCRSCGGDLGDEQTQVHARCLAIRRNLWATYRDRIIDAYGAFCACCGETGRLFLTIDHVNGDGRAHRRSLGGGNRRVMLAIINAGFPPDYQILCFNCNSGRARNGGVCPHDQGLYELVGAAVMSRVEVAEWPAV
jgi:hypothetical protein